MIHSTFHQDVPKAEYDILINPQMAFGTGHHETTSLIIGELLDSELTGKSLLDMGCGTSILAILARMQGAKPCTAIDIDEWCVRNSIENIEWPFPLQCRSIPLRDGNICHSVQFDVLYRVAYTPFVHHQEKNRWAAVKFVL